MEMQREVHEVSYVDVQTQVARDSSSQALDLLRSATDVDISGIVVEFFAPDSLHPDIRAVPKFVRIDKIRVAESSHAASFFNSEILETETVNLRSESATELKKNTKTDVNALSTSASHLILLIVLSILFLIIYFFPIFFNKSQK